MKLLKVVFSPQALQDLDEIWEYSFANWGLEKAESYTNEIRMAVTRLTHFLSAEGYATLFAMDIGGWIRDRTPFSI